MSLPRGDGMSRGAHPRGPESRVSFVETFQVPRDRACVYRARYRPGRPIAQGGGRERLLLAHGHTHKESTHACSFYS
jgi:hypothetical protein